MKASTEKLEDYEKVRVTKNVKNNKDLILNPETAIVADQNKWI